MANVIPRIITIIVVILFYFCTKFLPFYILFLSKNLQI